MTSLWRRRGAAAIAVGTALAAIGGCKSSTAPVVLGQYDATFRIQESASYQSGVLVASQQFAVSGVIADSAHIVGGLPVSVLAGQLSVRWASGAEQVVSTNLAPSPRYGGVIAAPADSALRLSLSGDTLTFEGSAVEVAAFSVDFAGAPVLPRISEPLPEAVLTPVSGLTVRWSALPGFDQVEASLVALSTPPESVIARSPTDQGFLTFSMSQVADLPAGDIQLRVTRSRIRTLSVPGLRGGSATLAATVTMPLRLEEPVITGVEREW